MRKESLVVCQCLLMSVCAWCSFVNELGICGNILGYIDMFQYVLGAQWCAWGLIPCGIQSGCRQTNQIWHNIKRQDCFLLTLSRHQNIKTSLCIISKNGWVFPFSVILTPVTKELQLTVFKTKNNIGSPCIRYQFWIKHNIIDNCCICCIHVVYVVYNFHS